MPPLSIHRCGRFRRPVGLVSGSFSWYFPPAMRRSSLHRHLQPRKPGGREPLPSPPSSASPQGATVGGPRRNRWGLALVVVVMLLGIGLERAGILDWRAGVALAQGYAGNWWLAPAVALVTAGLFSAGLPGSLMVFVAGILFPPTVAAPVFVAGGVVGALGAYSLARGVGRGRGGSAEHKEPDGRLLRLLARRSDFATLLAVRVAPSFPHSAINLAAGLLGVPRARFLASSALGLAIKGTLYVSAIHQAAGAATMEGAVSWRTILPLIGLALLLLLGPLLLRRLRERREKSGPLAGPVEPA